MRTFRKTASVVGVVYLAGFVVGIAGNILIQSILGKQNYLSIVSTNSLTVVIGAMLWLMAVVGDAAHGVLMFPVMKLHSERMAIGYLTARIVDAILIAVMVLVILIQIPLGSEYLKATTSNASYLQSLGTLFTQLQLYAYEFGMIAVGMAGLILCYTFYRTKLIPRWLAIWGLAGYAIILLGMVSALMGSGLGDIFSIPGGLWEVFIGVWLIIKGFNPTVIASLSTKQI